MTSMTLPQVLELAAQHAQAGRTAQSLALYQQILAQVPDCAEAMHGMAVLAANSGRKDEAIDLLRRAIAIDPKQAHYLGNLGNLLREKGQLEESLSACQKAVELLPTFANAWDNLGATLDKLGRLDPAIDAFREAVRHSQHDASANSRLCAALQKAGRLDEAMAACTAGLRALPDNAEIHITMGVLLRQVGDMDRSLLVLDRAVQLKPNNSTAWFQLGLTHRQIGHLDQAIASYQKSILLSPNNAHIHCSLGAALEARGDLDKAATVYRKALEFNPEYFEACVNLGGILDRLGYVDEAQQYCLRAVKLDPDVAEAHSNLAGTYKNQGELDLALEEYRHAMRLKPDALFGHSNLVYTAHFHPRYDAAKLLEENRNWAMLHERPQLSKDLPHRNDRSPDRPLRIGYVSPYFWTQAESYFMAPLLANHDHSQFEIFCYSISDNRDLLTDVFARCADMWREPAGYDDDQIAQIIRRDKVDILIDLAMHMGGGRPLIFARKPAPIQVAYLAYPGSTGMQAMDYLFTDSYMDPPEAPWSLYVEKPMRLPNCWCVYDPLCIIPPAQPRPAGPICFGSLNNPCKLNDPLLRLWAKVLRRVPDSTLLLQTMSGVQQKKIQATLESEGIDAVRVKFVGRILRVNYLRIYDQIDICLDPLPYNGITTTCDALWMGVPVVSLDGNTSAGRAGGSILRTAGLADLVTQTEAQFIETTLNLAADADRRAKLRTSLRAQFQQSPMMDGPRFARNVEAAYRHMWHVWCDAQQQ